MSMTRRCLPAVVALLLVLMASPSAVRAQAGAANGTWIAQGSDAGKPAVTQLTLELTQRADSVMGQLVRSRTNGPSDASLPVWGVIRQDSLFLSVGKGMPVVAAQLKGNLLLGRMAAGGRAVPSMTSLASAPRVRFIRQ